MHHYKSTLLNSIPFHFTKVINDSALEIISLKTSITQNVTNSGFNFRFATTTDIPSIISFQQLLFPNDQKMLETGYELFRIIQFGYVLLITDNENQIKGFYTTAHYSRQTKIGYGIRVGISPTLAGHNFAALLAQYAIILAYEDGCTHFKAVMRPTNLLSASNVLNHVGYYCENFHRDFAGIGPRFEITLPLTDRLFADAEIDFEKVHEFMKVAKENEDFVLINPADIDTIEEVYKKTNFKISAFLRKENSFFAIQATEGR